jgi:hypothetical protein
LRESRFGMTQWPPYAAFRDSKRLLTQDFESSAQELVLGVQLIERLWSERRTMVGLLKNDPRVLEFIAASATHRNAMPMALQRATRQRIRAPHSGGRWAGNIMTELNLSPEDVRAYLKDLRRRIAHLSRAAFRREESLKSLVSTSKELLERCELYACRCGCFQQATAGGCEACGTALTRGPSAAVRGAEAFATLINKGIYLELDVSRVLDDNGFEVHTGEHVQGLSGVDHEIDVLARSRAGNLSLLVEVTRKPANMEELANLVLRKADIPAHGYALVSSNSLTEECGRFAAAHGIAVFPSIQDRPESLVEWLKAIQQERGTAIRPP